VVIVRCGRDAARPAAESRPDGVRATAGAAAP